jgi:hypothetical protein
MRRITGILFFVILSLLISSMVFANLTDLTGTWINADSNTNGITKVSIQNSGSNITVQAWGKCSPSDCDWGTVSAKAYGSSVTAVLPSSAIALSADFSSSGISNRLLIKRAGNQLQVQDLTTYTDGRSSRFSTYTFNRQIVPIGPILTIVPLIPLAIPQQISPANNITFYHYPRTTTLAWTPVDGAASYTVEIDCYSCCQSGKWCSDIGQQWKVVTGLTTTSYTFDFVGAQPGRWRVWAVKSGGQQSAKSGWWDFTYKK